MISAYQLQMLVFLTVFSTVFLLAFDSQLLRFRLAKHPLPQLPTGSETQTAYSTENTIGIKVLEQAEQVQETQQAEQVQKTQEPSHFCDPYSFDGKVDAFGNWVANGAAPQHCSSFRTYSDNLRSLLDPFQVELPGHLQNKLIILVGDSFERNLIGHICSFPDAELIKASLEGVIQLGEGKHDDCQICTIRKNGKVFVTINIVHFGVRLPENAYRNWWSENLSPFETSVRMTWIPNFLRSVAAYTFPELCTTDSCPPPTFANTSDRPVPEFVNQVPLIDPADPFWFPAPDIVVAQSGLWDLKQRTVEDPMPSKEDLLAEWENLVFSEMFNPLKKVLGHVVTGENLLIRTIPLVRGIGVEDVVDNLPNDHIVEMTARIRQQTGLEVLDWAKLIDGREWWNDDGFHPNGEAIMAYFQLLLSRMELLANA
ncbi:hypothetical protein HK100_011349 [Physocladia obscura]|uniref:Uncharacterized protein n=1 Tax=Physocladia obscura TaxID=109957 RepID=A0AAD5T2A2_9FUNG|nr:hypothetical protein HK100_011349 [Physocladia obscura]